MILELEKLNASQKDTSMHIIPDRAAHRAKIVMRKTNCGPGESCGNCVKCNINADIKRRAALPENHPEYAKDDDETTGTMGIRDTDELRKTASKLRSGN